MTFTPSSQDLITATYTAALAIVGWAIISQINTNKALLKMITEVIQELRTAIALWDERDKGQQQICNYHKGETTELKKYVDLELRKLKHEIETLKNNQK